MLLFCKYFYNKCCVILSFIQIEQILTDLPRLRLNMKQCCVRGSWLGDTDMTTSRQLCILENDKGLLLLFLNNS
jgi:hypothetical protein